MEHPAPAQTIARPPEDCKLSQVGVLANSRGNSLEISRSAGLETEIATSTTPRVSKVWYDRIAHPAGASRTAVVIHEYINWTDGAQTARAGFSGGWLCVHPGAGWPDALEVCPHIELLTGGRS